MPREPIRYCARCGRLDRVNEYGLCADCSALPNVIELELEQIEGRDTAQADHRHAPPLRI